VATGATKAAHLGLANDGFAVHGNPEGSEELIEPKGHVMTFGLPQLELELQMPVWRLSAPPR